MAETGEAATDSSEVVDPKAAALEAKAKGNELFAKEDYDQALVFYNKAIELDPSEHVYFANRSATLMELKKYPEALADATKCVELGPSWAKGYLRKANAELALRKNAEAEATCRAGLALEPTNLGMRLGLQTLRDRGYETDMPSDKAMVDLTLASDEKAKGNELFTKKNFADAAKHFTAAMAYNPFDHVFYSNRSACHAEMAKFEEALSDAERCIALSPEWAKGYNRHSLALYELGRYPEAEAAALKGLKLEPDNEGLKGLLQKAKLETCESPEVQKFMYEQRKEQRNKDRMMKMLGNSGLDFSKVKMFGGGLGGLGGGFGGMSNGMNDAQMRQMARAMAQAKAMPKMPDAADDEACEEIEADTA